MKTIIKRIKSGKFDFERVMAKGTYFGSKIFVQPLFCSYGQIGWDITYKGENI